jgi:hypothetical protein
MKKNAFLFLFLSGLFACKNSTSSIPDISSVKEAAFKKFIARQRLIDLPVNFNLAYISDTLTEPMLVDSLDSLFIPTDLAAGRIWGICKDTSQFFALITLDVAAVYIPGLRIYDKQGNLLQDVQLLVNGCGADCGYYCTAIAKIYKDTASENLKFYAQDSVYSYTCDSLGKETPGTKEHYIKSKSGTIDKQGRVTIRDSSMNLME